MNLHLQKVADKVQNVFLKTVQGPYGGGHEPVVTVRLTGGEEITISGLAARQISQLNQAGNLRAIANKIDTIVSEALDIRHRLRHDFTLTASASPPSARSDDDDDQEAEVSYHLEAPRGASPRRYASEIQTLRRNRELQHALGFIPNRESRIRDSRTASTEQRPTAPPPGPSDSRPWDLLEAEKQNQRPPPPAAPAAPSPENEELMPPRKTTEPVEDHAPRGPTELSPNPKVEEPRTPRELSRETPKPIENPKPREAIEPPPKPKTEEPMTPPKLLPRKTAEPGEDHAPRGPTEPLLTPDTEEPLASLPPPELSEETKRIIKTAVDQKQEELENLSKLQQIQGRQNTLQFREVTEEVSSGLSISSALGGAALGAAAGAYFFGVGAIPGAIVGFFAGGGLAKGAQLEGQRRELQNEVDKKILDSIREALPDLQSTDINKKVEDITASLIQDIQAQSTEEKEESAQIQTAVEQAVQECMNSVSTRLSLPVSQLPDLVMRDFKNIGSAAMSIGALLPSRSQAQEEETEKQKLRREIKTLGDVAKNVKGQERLGRWKTGAATFLGYNNQDVANLLAPDSEDMQALQNIDSQLFSDWQTKGPTYYYFSSFCNEFSKAIEEKKAERERALQKLEAQPEPDPASPA